jgi:uncharacterized cupredoxin-like copper-binding protein
MRRNRRGLAFLIAGAVAALALAGAALATLTARSSGATATIKVTEREYHIALSSKSVHAGKVTFVVHDAGRLSHRFDISGPGLSTKKTPLIAAGTTRSLAVKLGGGTFHIWCSVAGHAALGMKTTLKVTAASSGAGAGSGTTGGTTTGGGDAWG